MPAQDTKSLIIPLVLLAIVYAISIIFFHLVEGWNFLDAAYYTTITIATVGYGDYTPHTDLGKIGAIALIFSGTSIALYVITHIGSTFRERTIDPHVRSRLEILRNLTMLQTGKVDAGQIKKIKERIQQGRDEKSQGFGKI
jgi:voltage-gated potassium channel Kch